VTGAHDEASPGKNLERSSRGCEYKPPPSSTPVFRPIAPVKRELLDDHEGLRPSQPVSGRGRRARTAHFFWSHRRETPGTIPADAPNRLPRARSQAGSPPRRSSPARSQTSRVARRAASLTLRPPSRLGPRRGLTSFRRPGATRRVPRPRAHLSRPVNEVNVPTLPSADCRPRGRRCASDATGRLPAIRRTNTPLLGGVRPSARTRFTALPRFAPGR